jgi:hypothetical protein
MADPSDAFDERAGEPGGAADLLPLVYGELRTLAAAQLAAEPAGHTLQPTALGCWRRMPPPTAASARRAPPPRPALRRWPPTALTHAGANRTRRGGRDLAFPG